jgi:hypothetical protein
MELGPAFGGVPDRRSLTRTPACRQHRAGSLSA